MNEPFFRIAQKEDVPYILEMSKNRAELTEVYTSVSVCGEEPYIGSLWVGVAESGEICGIIFDTGTYVINAVSEGTRFIPSGDRNAFFGNSDPEKDLMFMEFCPEDARCHDVKRDENIREISGKGLAEIYRLAKGGDLGEYNEKRYLYNYLCSNKGFSRSYGYFAGDRLIATVSVGAKNNGFALVSNVFTHPLRRGEGLASALLQNAVKNALASGLIPVLVCEKRLAGFYEKEGFRVNGRKL